MRFCREYVLLLVLIAIAVVMSLVSPHFLTANNLLKQPKYVAEAGIIACGMTLAIMTGGIDLSVGSILALCSITFGYTINAYGLPTAIALALLVGLACGAFNASLITIWRLPPLVVTLATMALFRGIAMVISRARPVSHFPGSFLEIGQGGIRTDVGIVPNQLLIWLGLVVVAIIVTHKTRLGRFAAAIGDNERAANFAAIPTNRVRFIIYTAIGLLSAFASLIYTARVNTAKADAGLGLELDVIVAVVLGGTAMTGGRGTAFGTFLGILILGYLRNGMSLAGVRSVYVELTAGVLLIATALLNQRLLERAARKPGKKAASSTVA